MQLVSQQSGEWGDYAPSRVCGQRKQDVALRADKGRKQELLIPIKMCPMVLTVQHLCPGKLLAAIQKQFQFSGVIAATNAT